MLIEFFFSKRSISFLRIFYLPPTNFPSRFVAIIQLWACIRSLGYFTISKLEAPLASLWSAWFFLSFYTKKYFRCSITLSIIEYLSKVRRNFQIRCISRNEKVSTFYCISEEGKRKKKRRRENVLRVKRQSSAFHHGEYYSRLLFQPRIDSQVTGFIASPWFFLWTAPVYSFTIEAQIVPPWKMHLRAHRSWPVVELISFYSDTDVCARRESFFTTGMDVRISLL